MSLTPNQTNWNQTLRRMFLLAILPIVFGCGRIGPAASITVPPMQGDGSAEKSEPSASGSSISVSDGSTLKPAEKMDDTKMEKMETATFGAGCFWCVEAVFQKLKGVEAVRSGYMGGRTINPTYEDICSGLTGHAEVIQVDFDPSVISFAELLEVFWSTHDPTTLNRQGYDVGSQYRSAVFFHNEAQQAAAEQYKNELNEAKAFPDPIVTEIVAAKKMYIAEDYHQNYYNNNPNQGYCRAIIPAKLAKLKKVFGDKLKDSE
jgi:peptide-methionine (S)-S-oxide reductase